MKHWKEGTASEAAITDKLRRYGEGKGSCRLMATDIVLMEEYIEFLEMTLKIIQTERLDQLNATRDVTERYENIVTKQQKDIATLMEMCNKLLGVERTVN